MQSRKGKMEREKILSDINSLVKLKEVQDSQHKVEEIECYILTLLDLLLLCNEK